MTTLIEQQSQEAQRELFTNANSALDALEQQIQRVRTKLQHVKTVEFVNDMVKCVDDTIVDLRQFAF
jgi:ribosome-associated translation inhibitor RaiA